MLVALGAGHYLGGVRVSAVTKASKGTLRGTGRDHVRVRGGGEGGGGGVRRLHSLVVLVALLVPLGRAG